MMALPLVFALLLLGGWGFTRGREREACCARCRYPTVGLSGDICPECGGDLRGAGTRPAGSRILVRPHPVVAILCRTLLVGGTVAGLSLVGEENGGVLVSRATAHAQSGGQLFQSVRITGRGNAALVSEYHAGKQRVARVPTTARLVGPRRTVTMRVLDAQGRVRYDGPDGRVAPDDGLSVEHVLRWMQAAGVDATQAGAEVEARALHTLIWHVVADGGDVSWTTPVGGLAGLGAVSVASKRYRTFSGWWMTGILGTLGAAWVLLVLDVVRWGRVAERVRAGGEGRSVVEPEG